MTNIWNLYTYNLSSNIMVHAVGKASISSSLWTTSAVPLTGSLGTFQCGTAWENGFGGWLDTVLKTNVRSPFVNNHPWTEIWTKNNRPSDRYTHFCWWYNERIRRNIIISVRIQWINDQCLRIVSLPATEMPIIVIAPSYRMKWLQLNSAQSYLKRRMLNASNLYPVRQWLSKESRETVPQTAKNVSTLRIPLVWWLNVGSEQWQLVIPNRLTVNPAGIR